MSKESPTKAPPASLPTEATLDASAQLDRLDVSEVLATIHAQDGCALAAVAAILPEVERAVVILAEVLSRGGRWFNIGAGTSGRMGVLDASEIPPTFGLPPDRVVGLIAGGPDALRRSIEGAEDDAAAARSDLRDHGLGPDDVVLALSASGRTPYALAALATARDVGARRLALTCDPDSPLAAAAEVALAPAVGPEVIAGSTRMKGGLAQKMVLHMLSTATLVRLGRVEGNRMTHLRPVSEKLRRRACRIVAELGGVEEARAEALLRACGGEVSEALALARREA
ncbi:MAG: N-acetylmuramic acid 6-phosphate etherase [Deltaproteobacteria bacterium]|nr:N-acetylmuramic acid 6-phosphate etherase [Deltaproteobacteria bacterium]